MEPIKHVTRSFDDDNNCVTFICIHCARRRTILYDMLSTTELVDAICKFFEEHRECKGANGLQQ